MCQRECLFLCLQYFVNLLPGTKWEIARCVFVCAFVCMVVCAIHCEHTARKQMRNFQVWVCVRVCVCVCVCACVCVDAFVCVSDICLARVFDLQETTLDIASCALVMGTVPLYRGHSTGLR